MMVLNWLSSIGESIGIFIQFVTSTISGILSVFALVGRSFVFLTSAVSYLPSVLLVFVTAGLTITIVYHLIGR